MKNWYCKPASEAEAIEIVERAVANGAVAEEVPRGFNSACTEFSWDYCVFWGTYCGKTITHGCTVLHDPGEQLTIQQVREQFPLPNEVKNMSDKKEWQGQQDGLPPVGTVCDCIIEGGWERIKVIGVYEDARWALSEKGHYITCCSTKVLRPLRTEREKWIEQAAIHANKEGYIGEELAVFIAGNIYDNMIKEVEQ